MRKSLINKVKLSGLEWSQESPLLIKIWLPLEGAKQNWRQFLYVYDDSILMNPPMRNIIYKGGDAYIILKRFIRAGKRIKKSQNL
jgi:hypothetical protein